MGYESTRVIKSPRRGILRRLALVGESPAAFYRDACAMLDEEARSQAAGHLVAHCLRNREFASERAASARLFTPRTMRCLRGPLGAPQG